MYEVPASKASIEQNRFQFHLPDDPTVYSLPKLQFIRPSLMKAMGGADAERVVLGLIEEYEPSIGDKFESLDQLLALYEAWGAASGINLGESSGSGDSSSSTAEPSTVTSSSPAVTSVPVTTSGISEPTA